MVIKVYYSSVASNNELRKHQCHIIDILEANGIEMEKIDITDPINEEERKFMQVNSKPKKEGQKPLPPQVFNDDEYCGDYESFYNHIETDRLYEFLKMTPPQRIIEESG